MIHNCAICGRGFHKLCPACRHGNCHEDEEPVTIVKPDEGGTKKHELKDPKSTGRKRAAKLYPLEDSADCEWQMQKNCGGGRRPIVGCKDGKQKNRHHGPIKDPTHNEEGNVHRICVNCHNRWHFINDAVYDYDDFFKLPHSPVAANEGEVFANEFAWTSGEILDKYNLPHDIKKRMETD